MGTGEKKLILKALWRHFSHSPRLNHQWSTSQSMECCLFWFFCNIISATFTFVIFFLNDPSRFIRTFHSTFPKSIFPLNSTAENYKMIEIELTTISLFQITFNRTAVWRRRYYLASAVSFVPLVSSRSFSPYCHLASPASTRSRSRNDYAPMITPFWKFHFFWPVLTFFFLFSKNFTSRRLRWIAFWNRHERRRKARAGAWSDRAIGILPCVCVLFAHFAASLASAGVKWNWIPPTGRNRSPLRSTKETKMFVTFSVWSFPTIVVGIPFLLLLFLNWKITIRNSPAELPERINNTQHMCSMASWGQGHAFVGVSHGERKKKTGSCADTILVIFIVRFSAAGLLTWSKRKSWANLFLLSRLRSRY